MQTETEQGYEDPFPLLTHLSKFLQVAHNLLKIKSPDFLQMSISNIWIDISQYFVIFSFGAKAPYLACLLGYLPHSGENPAIDEIEKCEGH